MKTIGQIPFGENTYFPLVKNVIRYDEGQVLLAQAQGINQGKKQ